MSAGPRPVRTSEAATRVVAWRPGPDGTLRPTERPDRLVVEEPLEIRVGPPGTEPETVALTMRTPGHDFELALGYLVSAGVLHDRDGLRTVAYCGPPKGQQEYNIVTVRLAGAMPTAQTDVFGDPVGAGPVVAAPALLAMAGHLPGDPPASEGPGARHVAALCTPDGTLETLRDDIDRHHAVDKVVGRALLDDHLPLADRVLVVSGRVDHETVRKAALAGVAFVAAVSAPSSLAVAAARRLGMTVVGNLRDGGFNVYTGPQRVGS